MEAHQDHFKETSQQGCSSGRPWRHAPDITHSWICTNEGRAKRNNNIHGELTSTWGVPKAIGISGCWKKTAEQRWVSAKNFQKEVESKTAGERSKARLQPGSPCKDGGVTEGWLWKRAAAATHSSRPLKSRGRAEEARGPELERDQLNAESRTRQS